MRKDLLFTWISVTVVALAFIAFAVSERRSQASANVDIAGRLVALDGRGIANAGLFMVFQVGEERYARTNPFGYFHFREIPTGNVTLTIRHKRFAFAQQQFAISGPADLVFNPLPAQTNFAVDATFGIGGKVVTDMGANDRGLSIMVQSDGKIVVVGSSSNRQAIARYTAQGALDTGFGTGGRIVSQDVIMPADLNHKPGALQADDKIISVGYNNPFDFVVERRNTDGSPDPGFDGDGQATLDFGLNGPDIAKTVYVLPDGKILVAGTTQLTGSNNALGLVRFNSNGSLDTTFGNSGKALADTPNLDDPKAITLQTDGKIVVSCNQQSSRQMIVRFNADGTLDQGFGVAGIATVPRGGLLGYDVAVQRDGKILGMGEGLVRYFPDGSADSAFNGIGGAISIQNVEQQAVAVRADGLILVGGRSFQVANTGGDFGLALIHPYTGALISRIETDILDRKFEDPKDVLILPDGSILVAGYISATAQSDFAIVKYINF